MNLDKFTDIPFKWKTSSFDSADCIGLVNLVMRYYNHPEIPTESIYSRDDYLSLPVSGLLEIADNLTFPAMGDLKDVPTVALLSFKCGRLGGVGIAYNDEILFTDMVKSRLENISSLRSINTIRLLDKRLVL